jgi:hypothetical protein
MLGMRSVRDLGVEFFERAEKLMDKGLELMDKTIEYISQLKRLTGVVIQTLELQQEVLDRDLELKKAELNRYGIKTKTRPKSKKGRK